MNTGRATGARAPEGSRKRRGRTILAVVLVVLCGAGAAWFALGDRLIPSSRPQVANANRTRQAAAKKAQAGVEQRREAPRTKVANTGGGPESTAAAPAASAKAIDSVDAADAADKGALGSRGAGTGAGQDTPDRSPKPESLADFRPASVYSGTLGEMTRLQADSQLAMADLTLKEVQAKLARIERESLERAVQEPAAPGKGAGDERLTSLERRVQASIEEMLARLDAAEKKRAGAAWQVLAVRGTNGALEAELWGAGGRRLVRVGDELENGERVDEITRSNVRLAGRALPWR